MLKQMMIACSDVETHVVDIPSSLTMVIMVLFRRPILAPSQSVDNKFTLKLSSDSNFCREIDVSTLFEHKRSNYFFVGVSIEAVIIVNASGIDPLTARDS